jgi:hypothetical protein
MALRDTGLKKLELSVCAAFSAMTACIVTILAVFYLQGTRYNMTFGYDMPLAELKSNWSNSTFAAFNSFGRMAYVTPICWLAQVYEILRARF